MSLEWPKTMQVAPFPDPMVQKEIMQDPLNTKLIERIVELLAATWPSLNPMWLTSNRILWLIQSDPNLILEPERPFSISQLNDIQLRWANRVSPKERLA